MKEIIKYLAYDGTVFEDEGECMNYEAFQRLEPYLNNMELRLYSINSNGSVDKINNQQIQEDVASAMESCDCVAIETDKALRVFVTLARGYVGLCGIGFKEPGIYAYNPYNDTTEEWVDVKQQLQFLKSIMDGVELPLNE